MVEHVTFNHVVVGSIPTPLTTASLSMGLRAMIPDTSLCPTQGPPHENRRPCEPGRPAVAAPALALGCMLATICASTAQAALPPKYQRAREMAAALDAATAILEGELVDGIDYLGDDIFRVRAGGCVLRVEIVDTPRAAPSMPGPRAFTARAGRPVCR